MPLARFHLYAQGVEIWVAPTLARGDGWIATMRHIAREGRVWVVGVNPCLRVEQIPADFPDRDRVWPVDPMETRPSGSSRATASSATPTARSSPDRCATRRAS